MILPNGRWHALDAIRPNADRSQIALCSVGDQPHHADRLRSAGLLEEYVGMNGSTSKGQDAPHVRHWNAASKKVSLLVTDLDNTLFDWLEIWYESFSAMLNKVAEISGIPVSDLEKEFYEVHQRRGTSEYAFALQELRSSAGLSRHQVKAKYEAAIGAYRAARDRTLHLYPRVAETLAAIRATGATIVGYTESMRFYTSYRMRALGLDKLLDYLYSPEDAELPIGLAIEDLERYPQDKYRPRHTELRHTPRGEKKPNPQLLLDIVRDTGGTPETTLYIGDSLMKDIAMAQDAGITDVWAKYGVPHDRAEYALLKRVTHWPPEDVAKEESIKQREREQNGSRIVPTYVLNHGFYELLTLFSYAAPFPRVP